MSDSLETTWLMWLSILILAGVIFLFLVWVVWAMIDTSRLLSKSHQKLKRGFCITTRPLLPAARHYLESLQADVYEPKRAISNNAGIISGFILVNEAERLIRVSRHGWRTGSLWPYVGYVDLSLPDPVLEFRASLPAHLVAIPFVFTGIGIPFIGFLMWLSYQNEIKTIEQYLTWKGDEAHREP